MSQPIKGNQIPGRAYLLLSVTIFAAANSVTRRLNELGKENLIEGRNPISFCNVLSQCDEKMLPHLRSGFVPPNIIFD
jgi:hypothetical protein